MPRPPQRPAFHYLPGKTVCPDLFRRPDGTFGFEEYRREPEDGRGRFVIGHHGHRVSDSEAAALAAARRDMARLDRLPG
ncbi:MAG: hypothetical protein ACLFTP_00885 [Rhodosalinus sp.]|uniref:hypothetical protein n=1 Tax=Rhodosalinus sp. TaxID=2047741 RepID=UPI00397E7B63